MATSENGRLEESLANLAQAQIALVQAQAALVQNQAALVAQVRETDAQVRKTDTRIGEIERANSERFTRIEALLIEHNRMLLALPEAVRQKIGFAGES